MKKRKEMLKTYENITNADLDLMVSWWQNAAKQDAKYKEHIKKLKNALEYKKKMFNKFDYVDQILMSYDDRKCGKWLLKQLQKEIEYIYIYHDVSKNELAIYINLPFGHENKMYLQLIDNSVVNFGHMNYIDDKFIVSDNNNMLFAYEKLCYRNVKKVLNYSKKQEKYNIEIAEKILYRL